VKGPRKKRSFVCYAIDIGRLHVRMTSGPELVITKVVNQYDQKIGLSFFHVNLLVFAESYAG
jgi:hypothetical protein